MVVVVGTWVSVTALVTGVKVVAASGTVVVVVGVSSSSSSSALLNINGTFIDTPPGYRYL